MNSHRLLSIAVFLGSMKEFLLWPQRNRFFFNYHASACNEKILYSNINIIDNNFKKQSIEICKGTSFKL